MVYGVFSTMVFIRLKRIKGIIYVYIVRNYWDKELKQSRQKVIGYLGKVKGLSNFDAKNVFERDKYSCQICGYMQNLTIVNKNDSIYTVCLKCKDKSREIGNDLTEFKDFYW